MQENRHLHHQTNSVNKELDRDLVLHSMISQAAHYVIWVNAMDPISISYY